MARWRFGEPVAPLREILARGGVLAIPTESSYGLAVDPRSSAGVAAVFAIKGRGWDKPLPVVLANAAQAGMLGVPADDPGLLIAAAHWPAALSVVVEPRQILPAMAGAKSLAVRVPAHDRLRELLAELAHPLTATSANRSGQPAIEGTAALDELLTGRDAIIVDDGPLPGGPASTLVVWETAREDGASGRRRGCWRVLRSGRFDPARLEVDDAGS